MAVTAALRSRVQAALRRQRPHSVKVYRVDSDDPLVITPKGERGRWERVVQSLPPDAERIELVEKDGSVMWALDVEQPAGETPDDKGPLSQRALLELLIRGQDMACERQMNAVTGVLKQYENLAKLLAERLTSLERGYSQVLSAAFESTVMAAEATAKMNQAEEKGDEESTMDKLAGELVTKLMGDGKNGVVQKVIDKKAVVQSTVVQKG